MKSLSKTKLSSTVLRNKSKEIETIETPGPLKVTDIVPQGKVTSFIEVNTVRSPDEIKNVEYWEEQLRLKQINKDIL